MRILSFESRNRSSRSLQVEPLEARQLLSAMPWTATSAHVGGAAFVAPANSVSDGLHHAAAVITPLATKLQSVVGSYTGSIAVSGVHNQAVKVTISKQTAAGVITGTLTAVADPRVKVTMTGKVLPGNTFSVTLTGGGSHAGGPIAGTGTGTITVSGKHITLTVSINFTNPFTDTGTLTLKK